MARATRLTPEVQQQIITSILAGSFVVEAAQRAGVHRATLDRWRAKGDPDGHPDEPDLDKMAVTDLRRLCKTHGIPIKTPAKRNEMATALEAVGAGSFDRYRVFRAAIDEAEAQLQQRLVAQWQQTMSPITEAVINPDGTRTERIIKQAPWQSIATFLSRRFPQQWSQPLALELSGPDGGPITVTAEDTLARQVKAFLEGVTEGEKAPADTGD